jgi:PAS domain-containing protein
MNDWNPVFTGWRNALFGILSLRGEPPAVLAVGTRRSESLLRDVIDTMVDPHVVLRAVRDRDGRITDFVFLEANSSACVFHQLPHEQLIGRSLIELHPANQPTELFQAYIQVVETGEPLILDDWMNPQEMLGRSQRRYDLRAVKLVDGINQTWRDVTADGLVLSLRLIDDRVAMERQLDEEIQHKLLDSQRLAAYVEEIAAVGSWQLDHASGQLRGSLQFHRCMDLGEPGAALDLPQFLAAIQPADQDRFQATFQQAHGDGRAFEEHVRVPIGGQSLRPVVIRGVTRLDASGRTASPISLRGEHPHAEGLADAGHGGTDLAITDDAQRSPGQLDDGLVVVAKI